MFVCALCYALLAAGRVAPATVLEAAPPETLAELTCPAQYTLRDQGSAAVDIRWAGQGSAYILRAEHGTTLHRVAEGMPEVRQVLPGDRPQERIREQLLLAVSDEHILSSDGHHSLWRPHEAVFDDSLVRTTEVGGFGDVDLWRNHIAILGSPGPGYWEDALYARLWLGSLTDESLGDFEPLLHESEPSVAEGRRVTDYVLSGAGSLRFLEDGSLFVYLGFRPQALLFSPQGAVKRSWNLERLGLADEASDRLLDAGAEGDYLARQERWRAGARVVDDVLVIGNDPALIRRVTVEGKSSLVLTVLTSEEESRSYRIPVTTVPGSRVHADVNDQGDILILVGGKSDGGQAVVVCDSLQP